MLARIALSIVVPIHNEELHLPQLLESLRRQVAVEGEAGEEARVVLVDNASTDATARQIAACPEVADGRWHALVVPTIGKFHAIRVGTRFAVERLHATHVAFVDADTRLSEPWRARVVQAIAAAGERFGYSYGPYAYAGFEALPVFGAAYRAYQEVLHGLQRQVGWFSHGSGGAHAADVLERYFATAEVTTELDLRQSLLALALGRRAAPVDAPVVVSGRRIVVDPSHLAAWCLYDPRFYAAKDINALDKVSLNGPATAVDLEPHLIDRCFARRAEKLAARNVVPLALFDRDGAIADRVRAILSLDGWRSVAALRAAVGNEPVFLTTRFEALLREVERSAAARELAGVLADRMRAAHADAAAAPAWLEVVHGRNQRNRARGTPVAEVDLPAGFNVRFP